MKGSAILAASLLAFAAAAGAQSQGDDEVWSVSLGGGGIYRPDYEGSDDYELNGLPMLGVSYRDIVVLQGASLMIDVMQLSGSRLARTLSFGPIARFDRGREADDNPILRNLGDIDEGALAGVFVNYDVGAFELGLTAMQDASSRHEGVIAELEAGYAIMLAPRMRAQLEISGVWTDDDYTQAYFGITPAQAQASGLREYSAKAGVKDVGASATLHYMLTEHWRVTGRLAYRRLLGDAADSPLVEDEGSSNQASAALIASYQF